MEPVALPLDDDANPPEQVGTVAIELNFKAFADNVPTHQQATRAPTRHDPSIQDFADQALELAALRAELKRLTRDYELAQQQAVAREARLEAMRLELSAARMQLRDGQRQPKEEPQIDGTTIELAIPPETPYLVPFDPRDPPVALARDIITIGRTRSSDVCIPSRGVSRDHARLMVAPGKVTLVDVSATNGCFVNDVLVKRHRLRDGDIVRIGDRSFRFVLSLSATAAASDSP